MSSTSSTGTLEHWDSEEEAIQFTYLLQDLLEKESLGLCASTLKTYLERNRGTMSASALQEIRLELELVLAEVSSAAAGYYEQSVEVDLRAALSFVREGDTNPV